MGLRTSMLMVGSLLASVSSAQCTTTISTFPYQEGFESGPAWTSGGSLSDWAWGVPAHPNINNAAEGTRVWCVGGLTGAFYNYSQQSWLESPCFDFSTLPYPYLSFKMYWECERTYDGMGFQYSLDAGASWDNLGAFGAEADCVDTNWFNTAFINNLDLATPSEGWSGRVGGTSGSCAGGGGSAGWVTVSQCLASLAGQPSVKFRFIFGAGSTCNSYDGIAVDDVYIGTAPPEEVSFQSSCFNYDLQVENIQSCATSWVWDFGEPSSGANNTSTAGSATHTYAAPGSYTLSLTLQYSCRPPQVLQLVHNILDLMVVETDPTCAGNDGSLAALVTNNLGVLTYQWNPGSINTSSINGLSAGNYTLNVFEPGSCPAGALLTLDPPPAAPTATATTTSVTCAGLADGSATVIVSGGTPPFTYAWAPSGGSGATAVGLAAGSYTCTVTDASACTSVVNVVVQGPDPVVVVAQEDVGICAGEERTLQADATGGTPDYFLTWLPEGPSVQPAVTTTYTVVATDANGCESDPDEVVVTVGDVSQPEFTMDVTSGCSPVCAEFTARSTAFDLAWDFGDGTTSTGGTVVQHCFQSGGLFDVTLTATDPNGCSGSWTMVDAVDVTASPVASFIALPAVTTIKDPLVRFVDASSGATWWEWTFGDGTDSISHEPSPAYTFAAVGCYPVELNVSNDAGCTSAASFLLCVEDEFAAYVPNAFTPNGDGFNDFWGVITTVGTPKEFELDVFDRWGGVLFSTTDKNILWDGTAAGGDQPNGVYPWRLRLRDTTGGIQERIGHVTLLR